MQLHVFEGFFTQYTPCQGMFWPPNEASLTQTNPATAHLFPRPPSATNSSWFAAQAALLSCLKPGGSRVHPVAISPSRPGIQSAFCPLTRHSLGRRPLPGRRYSAAVQVPGRGPAAGVPGPGPGDRATGGPAPAQLCQLSPGLLAESDLAGWMQQHSEADALIIPRRQNSRDIIAAFGPGHGPGRHNQPVLFEFTMPAALIN